MAGESLGYWRRLSARLSTDAGEIDRLAEIESARTLFETYSRSIIELEQRFGHKGSRTHYVSFCPMAFNNKGASWLARDEQINNPYFGASMLRCGEVRERIRPRDGERRQGSGR